MPRTIRLLGAMAVLATCVALAAPAAAQDERVWEQGSVWTVSYIQTKPGKFNAYVKDLSHVWRAFLEEQKKSGSVLSYKMLSVTSPRDGEPDLILLVETKNMAVFDQGPEVFEELSKKVMGSVEKAQAANIDRGELRTLRGSVLAREITFKN